MSAAGNGQITQTGWGFCPQRLDGPAREDIQSKLAQADRYVHPAEGIQKTCGELNSKSFLLSVRHAIIDCFNPSHRGAERSTSSSIKFLPLIRVKYLHLALRQRRGVPPALRTIIPLLSFHHWRADCFDGSATEFSKKDLNSDLESMKSGFNS